MTLADAINALARAKMSVVNGEKVVTIRNKKEATAKSAAIRRLTAVRNRCKLLGRATHSDEMNTAEFDMMMQICLDEAENDTSLPATEVFAQIRKEI